MARARAAMLAEAQRKRGPGWTASFVLVFGVGLTLVALIALAGLAAGAFTPALILSHLPSMLVLAAVPPLLWLAAFRPGSRPLRLASLAGALLAMALIVVLRRVSPGEDTSRWSCTLSHLGVALVPGAVTLIALRRAAFNPLRAWAAGLGVGALGAFAGELGCAQGPLHVLVFHLSAWLFSSVLITWLASRVRPSSFAP
jgi:uncharacterized membrane protein YwaF